MQLGHKKEAREWLKKAAEYPSELPEIVEVCNFLYQSFRQLDPPMNSEIVVQDSIIHFVRIGKFVFSPPGMCHGCYHSLQAKDEAADLLKKVR